MQSQSCIVKYSATKKKTCIRFSYSLLDSLKCNYHLGYVMNTQTWFWPHALHNHVKSCRTFVQIMRYDFFTVSFSSYQYWFTLWPMPGIFWESRKKQSEFRKWENCATRAELAITTYRRSFCKRWCRFVPWHNPLHFPQCKCIFLRPSSLH